MDAPEKYDGIYFLPGDNEEELMISYFDFKNEMAGGTPQESTQIGDKWHIAFFKKDANGDPMFDDAFEGIFGDPSAYVNNLVGAKVYGCMVRKTEKSGKWFEEYLTKTMQTLTINKLKKCATAIANN
jgi:hypothetical protein